MWHDILLSIYVCCHRTVKLPALPVITSIFGVEIVVERALGVDHDFTGNAYTV